MGPHEAALVGIDVCRAAGAVHAVGLLHRDIKASNVMREAGGRILLMDFGLTHERGIESDPSGTPVYMAPELLLGQPATIASEIYAIGVLLFYLLTGQYPFAGRMLRSYARRTQPARARPSSTCDRICPTRSPTWWKRRPTPIRRSVLPAPDRWSPRCRTPSA